VAEYKPEICFWCESATWCKIRSNGRPQCRACEIERFFTEILLPPLNYRLLDWQRKALRNLYGTIDIETGQRQYEHGFISTGKKNGKTLFIAGLPIYYLIMENDDYGKQLKAYGCGAAKDQAGLIFEAAGRFIKVNPDLRTRLRVLEGTKKILRRDGHGFYAVLSCDGDVQDGIEPGLLLRDEIHRWKGARAQTLYDVTTKGQITIKEPMDIAITTAGAEYESILWFTEYSRAKRVLSGGIVDPKFYVDIYEPDLKKLAEDPEYWKSREARVAGNPSHEERGGFLKDEKIVSEMNKALADSSQKSTYLRLNLNAPVTQEEEPIIEMPKWIACGGKEIDLRTWPIYDAELVFKKWNLVEKRCWAGVDASWSIDFTAVTFVFPPFQEEGGVGSSCDQWTLLPFFWIPAKKIQELTDKCRVPIKDWVERGFIEATPGSVIDQRAVMERLRWGRRVFYLIEIPYDRCNFRSEALNLADEGFVAPEIAQTFLGLSEATKFLITHYLEGGFRHGNNPVLNWMASCLQLQYDQKDNVQPTKPERLKSIKRIDGMQATVTALSRAILAITPKPGLVEVW